MVHNNTLQLKLFCTLFEFYFGVCLYMSGGFLIFLLFIIVLQTLCERVCECVCVEV